MEHVSALLIKLIMVAVVLEIIFSMMTSLSLGNIMLISAAVTILSYTIVDILILPTANNSVATFTDVGLAVLIIYMFNFLWNTRDISFLDSLTAAAVLGLGEWFFHKYVVNNVLSKERGK